MKTKDTCQFIQTDTGCWCAIDVCVSDFLVAHDFPFLVLAVIMSMENAAQGHTMVEEEEKAVMKNLQSGGSGSSSGTYHSPEDEFAHLFLKRGA
jgi:hypothetical protein